jgi:hypothetical protein
VKVRFPFAGNELLEAPSSLASLHLCNPQPQSFQTEHLHGAEPDCICTVGEGRERTSIIFIQPSEQKATRRRSCACFSRIVRSL